jgi:cobalt-zinc-cadmium efflux system protein
VRATPDDPPAMGRRLRRALLVTVALIGVKAAGAAASHSLALWADAGHSLSDVGALLLSWYGWRQAQRAPTAAMTFGFARTEVLVALVNSVVLIALAAGLVWAAVVRALHPVVVDSTVMLVTAALALGVNAVLARDFHGDPNVNVRATWLHLATDAATSLGVLLAALAIAWSRSPWVDPAVTVAIAAAMVWSAWQVAEETIAILMEGVPPQVSVEAVEAALSRVPGVVRVHDLHVWRIGSGQTALACHVAVSEAWRVADGQEILCRLHEALEPMGIDHVTIQLESGQEPHHEPRW